jgi:hypothetical protein
LVAKSEVSTSSRERAIIFRVCAKVLAVLTVRARTDFPLPISKNPFFGS